MTIKHKALNGAPKRGPMNPEMRTIYLSAREKTISRIKQKTSPDYRVIDDQLKITNYISVFLEKRESPYYLYSISLSGPIPESPSSAMEQFEYGPIGATEHPKAKTGEFVYDGKTTYMEFGHALTVESLAELQ